MKPVRFLKGATAAISVSLGLALAPAAWASERIVVISWGGTWGDAMRETLFEPFTAETGIEVELRTQGSMMDMLASLVAQRDRMDADVWITGMAPTILAQREGILQAIPYDRMPNAQAVPEAMRGEHYLGLWQIFYGLVYNSNSVPFEITSWEDIFDERLRDSISIPQASGYGGKFTLLMAWLDGGDEANADAAFDRLARLRPNVAVVPGSDADAIALITAGETDVATMMPVGNYLRIRESGDHFRYVAPEPFVPTNFNNFALLNGPNSDGAVAFMDFALRPDRQEALAERVLVMPVHPDAAVPEALSPFAPPPENLRYGDDFAISDVLPDWVERWNRVMQ